MLAEWRTKKFQQSYQGHDPEYCYDQDDSDERAFDGLVVENAAAGDDAEHSSHHGQSEEDTFGNSP